MLMEEWANYIKATEIEAGTEVGKNLAAEQGTHVKSTKPKKQKKAITAKGPPVSKARWGYVGYSVRGHRWGHRRDYSQDRVRVRDRRRD